MRGGRREAKGSHDSGGASVQLSLHLKHRQLEHKGGSYAQALRRHLDRAPVLLHDALGIKRGLIHIIVYKEKVKYTF
jgi:hypothetical protein